MALLTDDWAPGCVGAIDCLPAASALPTNLSDKETYYGAPRRHDGGVMFDGQLYSLRYAKGGLGWLSVLVDTVVFDNIDSDGKP